MTELLHTYMVSFAIFVLRWPNGQLEEATYVAGVKHGPGLEVSDTGKLKYYNGKMPQYKEGILEVYWIDRKHKLRDNDNIYPRICGS